MNRLAVARFGAYALVVGMFAGGLWLTEHRFDQSVAQLKAERAAREHDVCDTAVETRTEQRDMWVRVLQEAGVDEPTIDILREGYADLPTPASC